MVWEEKVRGSKLFFRYVRIEIFLLRMLYWKFFEEKNHDIENFLWHVLSPTIEKFVLETK